MTTKILSNDENKSNNVPRISFSSRKSLFGIQKKFSKDGEKAQRMPLTDIDDNIIPTESTNSNTNKINNNNNLDNLRYQSWKVDDFNIGKCLGHGHFGNVYEATIKSNNQNVALKTLCTKSLYEENCYESIQREIQIHIELKHPNIIRLYGSFEDESRCYLILESARKGNFYKILKSLPNKCLDEKSTSKTLYSICSAVDYCHSNQIIHRDIKPENILVTEDGILKLADFGSSIKLQNENERRKSYCGTVVYMSPEIIQNKSYNNKTDSWSIGVLMYELLFGFSPFDDVSDKKIKVNIVKNQFKINKFISICAKSFLGSLLEVDENKRMSVHDCLYHPFITMHHEDGKDMLW